MIKLSLNMVINKMYDEPVFIAGPCCIESAELLDQIASAIVDIEQKLNIPIIFKASFDKANRTSLSSFRGIGMEQGLNALDNIKTKYGLRLVTDIHESWQAEPVAEIVDILQIPAFLSRQTDLIAAAAKTGKIVHIKKGQFLSGEDIKYVVDKAVFSGAKEVWVSERGNFFGYNNLVIDYRNIPIMKKYADRVIMDCTHSLQYPGASDGHSGGERKYVHSVALAAKAFGAQGYYFEVHLEPEKALSDGDTMITPDTLRRIIKDLIDK